MNSVRVTGPLVPVDGNSTRVATLMAQAIRAAASSMVRPVTVVTISTAHLAVDVVAIKVNSVAAHVVAQAKANSEAVRVADMAEMDFKAAQAVNEDIVARRRICVDKAGANFNRARRLVTAMAKVRVVREPFGEWTRKRGGREFRGVRTERYTYTRSLDGPWLLFDNEKDPEQLDNLCDRAEHADLQAHMEILLQRELKHAKDEFLSGPEYIKQWNYAVDENGTMPYSA